MRAQYKAREGKNPGLCTFWQLKNRCPNIRLNSNWVGCELLKIELQQLLYLENDPFYFSGRKRKRTSLRFKIKSEQAEWVCGVFTSLFRAQDSRATSYLRTGLGFTARTGAGQHRNAGPSLRKISTIITFV